MTLGTGQGFWNPLLWLAAAAGATALAVLLWSRGRRDYTRAGEQTLPFLSGERAPGAHVGGGHLYWGFVEGLRPYVARLRAAHTGLVNDYVGWLVVVLAVVFLIVLGVG